VFHSSIQSLSNRILFGGSGLIHPTPPYERTTQDNLRRHYGRATFLENSRGKDAFRLAKQIYSA